MIVIVVLIVIVIVPALPPIADRSDQSVRPPACAIMGAVLGIRKKRAQWGSAGRPRATSSSRMFELVSVSELLLYHFHDLDV